MRRHGLVGRPDHVDDGPRRLDSMQAGRLLVILHHETGQDRYRIAAKKIRDRLDTYPRTADGGFWHADMRLRIDESWLGSAYATAAPAETGRIHRG